MSDDLLDIIDSVLKEAEDDAVADIATSSVANEDQLRSEAESTLGGAFPPSEDLRIGATSLADIGNRLGIREPRAFRHWIMGMLEDGKRNRMDFHSPLDLARFAAQFVG